MPAVEGIRSPYDKHAGGLHHLGRMLDKMRLKLAGRLPEDFQRNYGLSFGLDGLICGFLGVEFAAIETRVARRSRNGSSPRACGRTAARRRSGTNTSASSAGTTGARR